MPTKVVHVARRKGRARHPWVFSNEVRGVEGSPQTGDSVLVYDRGRLVGSGFYNSGSLIAVRIYSTEDAEFDQELIRRRLEQAWGIRQRVLPGEPDCRLAFGESDLLPGLVIDRFGEHFALQAYSAGIDRRLDIVIAALQQLFAVRSVHEKDDFRLREQEGLERRERLICGAAEQMVTISENGARFNVDIEAGQKTGYYYDQRLTRRRFRGLASGRRVLDMFCYTGSFAVNAALGGAERVLAADESASAIAGATRNAELNGVSDRCEFVAGDAFELLGRLARTGERFDLVNLDPPAFVKRKKEKAGGLKGYRTVNSLGMRLLGPGGILVSSSCSHLLSWQEMQDVLAEAAQDAGRSFTIVERTIQAPDHPILLSMPETEYLRGFVLRLN